MTPDQKPKEISIADQMPTLRIITSGIHPSFVTNENIVGPTLDVKYGIASNPPIIYRSRKRAKSIDDITKPPTSQRLIG